MSETIKDFDLLIPDKRIAKLAGKEFDVSKISTKMALKQAEYRDRALLMGEKKALIEAVKIVAEICGKPKSKNFFYRLFTKKIDEKWLISNTNFKQLVDFIDFVLEPLTGKLEENTKDIKKK